MAKKLAHLIEKPKLRSSKGKSQVLSGLKKRDFHRAFTNREDSTSVLAQ